MARVIHKDQIALISDLPEHGGKTKTIRTIRELDKSIVVAPNFLLAQHDRHIAECIEAIRESGITAVDTETRGKKWFLQDKKAVALNIYTPSNNKAYLIPCRMQHATRNFTDDEINEAFYDVMTDSAIRKIGHNFKYDIHWMRETWNIDIEGFFFDTMIASIVLNENESHSLDDLCISYLGARPWKQPMDAPFEIWPMRIATQYACKDAEMTYKLYEFQNRYLNKPKYAKLKALFEDMEMPTVYKASDMERRGVCFDMEYHETEVVPFIETEAAKAKAKVLHVTGDINLNAPAQVASAFFDMLGMPRIEENHVNEAALSTLKKQGYEVAGDLLDYRKYSTIDKMFVKKLPLHVVNGKIHCTFNTMGAETGRMSCKEPNLQQLPKRIGPVIRRSIVPSPGCVFVTMDYQQMELRLLAHFSEDPQLIQAFFDGKDIHTAVMCGMLGVSYEEYEANKDRPDLVAKRVLAKTVNFGVLYGMGPTKLAWKTGVTMDEAKDFIAQYFATYPGVKRFIDNTKTFVGRNGFVETISGRKRRLPDALSPDKAINSMAEREAVNSIIQGSAADFTKRAGLEQAALIEANRWPYQLLLQIHDELLYEVQRDWLQHNQKTLTILSDAMANVYKLRVPIIVSQEVLSRWGDKTVLEDDDSEDDLVA